MNTFYIAAQDSGQFINQSNRPKRCATMESAIEEAKIKMADNPKLHTVVILQAVKVVRREPSPVIVEDMTGEDTRTVAQVIEDEQS